MIKKVPFVEDEFTLPEIKILSFDALRSCQHSDPNKSSDHHIVEFYHIIFVTKGKEGVHYIDFKPYEYTELDVIISSKNQTHSLKTLPFHDGFLLTFTEKFLTSLHSSDSYLTLQLNNIVFSNPVVSIPKNQFNNLILLLKLAEEDINNNCKENIEIVKSYVKIILLKVLGIHAKENSNTIKSTDIQTFIQFQQLLTDHQYQQKEVSFYANLLHLSSKKLSHISKKVIGKTAKEYIISVILVEAKRLLKYSHLSVKEVSFLLGFDESTNFTKFFKKHSNFLPSQFIASEL